MINNSANSSSTRADAELYDQRDRQKYPEEGETFDIVMSGLSLVYAHLISTVQHLCRASWVPKGFYDISHSQWEILEFVF